MKKLYKKINEKKGKKFMEKEKKKMYEVNIIKVNKINQESSKSGAQNQEPE